MTSDERGRITEELIRRRSEHNEGRISSLKELTLHQFDLEKIELVGDICRQLEILFLQNNIIKRIENLNHLKKLKYLNLAVNNITRIENLSSCESLQKLDLTANFIPPEELLSVENLKQNFNLTELYLMGNPCTRAIGYRNFVIAALPQLKELDGEEILVSERIHSTQIYQEIRSELSSGGIELEKTSQDEEEYNYTPEVRESMVKEFAEKREAAKKPSTKNDDDQEIPRPIVEFKEEGQVLQKNQGEWTFSWLDTESSSSFVKLDIAFSRFLDTSLINVDLHPTYVHIIAKGKHLLLNFPEEVLPSQGKAERSKITGHLLIILPKAHPTVIPTVVKAKRIQEEKSCYSSAVVSNITNTNTSMIKALTGSVSTRIVKREKREAKPLIKPASPAVVDDDVPPLE